MVGIATWPIPYSVRWNIIHIEYLRYQPRWDRGPISIWENNVFSAHIYIVTEISVEGLGKKAIAHVVIDVLSGRRAG